MPSFEEYAAALTARDTIAKIVSDQLERDRPRYRYGYVQSIDRVNRVCTVQFIEGGDFVTVQMGSLQPQNTGQIVRVAGMMGDRFVDDVMGPAVFDRGYEGASIWTLQVVGGLRANLWPAQYIQSSGAFFGGYNQSSGSQGAWEETDLYIPGGNWQSFAYYYGGPNTGIGAITVDGAPVTTTFDTYHASTYLAALGWGPLHTLQPGTHTVRVTATNKNASSTGYYLCISAILFVYTGPLV